MTGRHWNTTPDERKPFALAREARAPRTRDWLPETIQNVGVSDDAPRGSKELHSYAQEPRRPGTPSLPRPTRPPRVRSTVPQVASAINNLMGGSKRHGLWLDDLGNGQCVLKNFKTKAVLFHGNYEAAVIFMDGTPLVV